MDLDKETAAAVVVLMVAIKKKKRRIRKRSSWVKPWLSIRVKLGVYDTLMLELRLEDESECQKFLRMTPQNFDEILKLIEGEITKSNTNMRDSIPANVKLAATIRFLATGDSYTDLQYQFKVHASTLSRFIPEVCDVIYRKLRRIYESKFRFYFLFFSLFIFLKDFTNIS